MFASMAAVVLDHTPHLNLCSVIVGRIEQTQ